MGNTISLDNNLFSNDLFTKDAVKCYICKKDIEKLNDLVKCVRCNIKIHYDCEEKYRIINNNNYCACPNCYKIGTLGIKY